MSLWSGGEGKKKVGGGSAGGADQENGAATVPVGEFSPDRREDKLHRGKRRDDDADDKALSAKMPAVGRHQGHDDSKADEVDENREENNQHRGFSHEESRGVIRRASSQLVETLAIHYVEGSQPSRRPEQGKQERS